MNKTKLAILALGLAACAVESGDETTQLEDLNNDDGTEQPGPLDFGNCELPPNVTVEGDLALYEGDMVLGPAERVLDELCNNAEVRGLGIDGGAFNNKRWPGGVVPYVIDESLPQKFRVELAIAEWQSKTDIDFVDVSADPTGDYVRFKNHNDACNAELGRKGGEQFVRLSTGKDANQIVGMSVNSQDRVYTWYDDGMVTVGTSSKLEAVTAQYPFELPPGYNPSDIVEIAIHPVSQHVFAWYLNGQFSEGTSSDLAHYASPAPFSKPNTVQMSKITGIDFAPNGTLYTWYRQVNENRRMRGNPSALNAIDQGDQVTMPPGQTMDKVRGMAVASNDWVYAWYGNNQVSAGWSLDLSSRKAEYEYATPGHCSTSAVIHEIGHTLGLKHEHTRCDRGDHVRVYYDNIVDGKEGNYYKDCSGTTDYGAYDTSSVMHYTAFQFSKSESPTLLIHPTPGVPADSVKIVGSAISNDDQVYTWWDNGSVTSGTSTNLESHRSRYYFTLPPADGNYTYTPSSIVGMGIAKSSNRVYTWYANGKVSVGTSSDLDHYTAPYNFSSPYPASYIREIGIAADDDVYVWYKYAYYMTGSRGTSSNLTAHQGPYPVSLHPEYSASDIVGIDISSEDVVYTWYDDGHLTRGNSTNLDAIDANPVPFRGRGIKPIKNQFLSTGDVATIESMY